MSFQPERKRVVRLKKLLIVVAALLLLAALAYMRYRFDVWFIRRVVDG